jgi:CHASE3 domain sensor protein
MKPIFSVKNRIRSGYVISLLLLLLSYFLIFYGQQRLSTGASAAIHAENVISRVEMLKSEFALAESGARGFLVTRDQRFLAHYQTAAERIPIIFNELEQNLGHGEKRQLDTLRLVLTDRLAEISAAVSEFKARGVLAPGGRRNEQTSLQVGDSVRLYTSRLMSEANQVVRGRQDQLTGMFDTGGPVSH